MSVPGFKPSSSGLHFSNSLPHLALLSIPTPFGDIDIGDAALGVCGGMVFTVRDFFEARLVPPLTTQPPSTETDPLYTYLVNRFYASFGLTVPPSPVSISQLASNQPGHYYYLMDPALPDHETELSLLGLAPHGRAWIMINEEWPKIKADIDNGHPSPIGLVLVKSLNPVALGDNHVVLVYGYDLNGTDLTLHIYDPNFPDNDNITLSLSIANPDQTTPVNYWPEPTINCFFHLDYLPVTPLQKATFVTQTPPPVLLTPGQAYNVSVTMQNTGISTWTSGGTPQRLGSQNPQDNTVWGLGRIDVPEEIPPGSSATFNFTAHAPTSTGIYQFQWRMVQEGVTWFGDFTSDVQCTIPKTTKEKEVKEKDTKQEKDGGDRTGAGIAGFGGSAPGFTMASGGEADPGTGQGRSFINPAERPAVGEQALREADEG